MSFFDNFIQGMAAGALSSSGSASGLGMDQLLYQQQMQAQMQNFGLASQAYDLEKQNYERNWEQQSANLDWMKTAQQTTWDREDNATQRRAADLQAAGLSKTLAAGGAAASASPVHLSSPVIDSPRGVPQVSPMGIPPGQKTDETVRAAISMGLNFAQSKADIDLTQRQAEKIAEEKKGVEIENLFKSDQTKAYLQQTLLSNILTGNSIDEKKLDVQLKRVGITTAEVEQRIKKIDATVKEKFGMSDADVSLAAKQQALDNAKLDQATRSYNLGKSQDYGLRTTDGLTGPETALEYFKAQAASKNAELAAKAAEDRKKKSRGASGTW